MKRFSALLLAVCLVGVPGAYAWERGQGAGNSGGGGKLAEKRAEMQAKWAEKRAEMQAKWADKKASGISGQEGNSEGGSGDRAAKIEEMKAKWAEKKAEIQEKIAEKKGVGGSAKGTEDPQAQGGAKRDEMKAKWEALGKQPQFQALRERFEQMRAAWQAKDGASLKDRLQSLKQQWQGMTPEDRSAVDQKIPGFSQKLATLFNKQWNVNGTHTGPAGNTQTYQGTAGHQGNTWNSQGTWTGQDGKLTGANGKTGTFQGTTVQNGNTATFDRSYVGPDGKVIKEEGTRTVVNGQTTVTKTIIGPDGKPHMVTGAGEKTDTGYETQWKNEKGQTVTHDATVSHGEAGTQIQGTWTGPDGKTYEGSSQFQVSPEPRPSENPR